MRKDRIPMVDGDEQDALTAWKNVSIWRPGDRRKIKNRYNRRARRLGKQEAK